ncbi:MAG: DNA polymerase Y family protein, partial [Gammaproteobacteria bacterium]
MLWLSANLPWLPLEVFVRGGRDGAPLAISSIAGRVPRVVACNGAARRLGVRTGMAVGAAQALAADLRVQPRDSIRER